jgi:hypothetical protein
MKILTRGNSKLDKSILCWSITPVASCLNCAQCARTCYARKPYQRYPGVRKAWDRNYTLAQSGAFIDLVREQLRAAKKVTAVRIHVSGDFFSAEYIKAWQAIAEEFPTIRFYGYSKCFRLFPELQALNTLKNVNIIDSIASDGGVNFGDVERVATLNLVGYRTCPATIPGNEVTCGKNCTLCQTEPLVCFHQH